MSRTLQTRAVVAIAAAAIALAALIALFGLPGGGSSSSSSSVTAVAEAAKRTASFPGARMTFVGQFDMPAAGESMTLEGEGVYNSAGRTRVMMRATDLPAEASSAFPGGFEMEQVMEVGPELFVMYMRSSAFAGQLPDGAEWMMIDMSEITPDSASLDPRSTLRQLRSVAEVEELGEETIRGIETTHYRAMVDQHVEVERLRDEGEDAAADALEQAIEVTGDTMEMELWIDSRNLVRRTAMEMPFEMGMPGASMRMTTDMSDYGIDPEIELPDDDSVYDATALAAAGAEQLSQ